jgi:predicted Rossmann fold flavoprotein
MKNNKVAIIGGGASGIFCAIILKKLNKNLDVTIYEAQSKIGKKILQTGNGKCNLSNTNLTVNEYNTDLVKDLIKEFDSNKLIKILNEMGLMVRIDDEGRIYPYSEKATTVLDIFLKQLNDLKVNVITDCYINNIKYNNSYYTISDNNKNNYNCDYLIIATGGCSSINYNYNTNVLVNKLNHSVSDLFPSLCALKTKQNTKHLSGIRVKCKASIIVNGEVKHQTKGEVLFKDDGLSGIAIFILSKYYEKNKNCVVSLDLFDASTKDELNNKLYNNDSLENNLLGYFPKMINYDIIKRASNKTIGEIIKDYNFNIIDTYGFNNSQVTKGGVLLNEININTFQSKKCNNLYIIGEALDVDGSCGGFNLHFAWASAFKCANDIVK